MNLPDALLHKLATGLPTCTLLAAVIGCTRHEPTVETAPSFTSAPVPAAVESPRAGPDHTTEPVAKPRPAQPPEPLRPVSGVRPRMSESPRAGLSLMLDDSFRAAALPLFAAGVVDAIEWSFDTRWHGLPPWAEALLDAYAEAGRLLGHGVTFSLLSAGWTERHDAWLRHAEAACARRRYVHVSEHFGCSAAGRFGDGPPLPMPFDARFVAIGRDRLARLAAATGRPVGLENLAFAFSRADDVLRQGAFLDALLEPGDGFLLLDVHNLWCQAVNFDVDPLQLASSYPLHRVRELHVSGGSWRAPATGHRLVRRDTHDASVPAAVWELLEALLPRCPQAAWAVLEQLGDSLAGADAQRQLGSDFGRLRDILSHHALPADAGADHRPPPSVVDVPLHDAELAAWQATLFDGLNGGRWQAGQQPWARAADAAMVATAIELVQRWAVPRAEPAAASASRRGS